MKARYYQHKWQQLLADSAQPERIEPLARQIANSFLDYYLKNCSYQAGYIQLLCEMSTYSSDERLTRPAAGALFGIIIERLCDDFETLQADTYNRVMAQVISFCRKIPRGRFLDTRLTEFGLGSGDDLVRRIQTLRSRPALFPSPLKIRKVIVLSRVTIGADVAVTSVFIQRLMHYFSNAKIVLIGSSRLADLYAANTHVEIRSLPYSRRGGLLERLESWHEVLDIVIAEGKGQSVESNLLIDSDSRLSQLGVLPLMPEAQYFFFDSRSDSSFNAKLSMAELVNDWMDKRGAQGPFCYPRVWLSRSDLRRAASICGQLRNSGAQQVISVNFGVGGNRRKTLGPEFEKALLKSLLQTPGSVVLLDRGAGQQELDHTKGLLAAMAGQGIAVADGSFDCFEPGSFNQGIIGLTSTIGQMAGLIAESSEFIGYDSACQHMAAAQKTAAITIFAGSNNMRFIRRWSAFGAGQSHIVHVDNLRDPAAVHTEDIITRIMNIRNTVNAKNSSDAKFAE